LRRNTLDTTSKFGRRAAGESEKKNAARVGAIDDQVGDSMRQSFGFARPRAGDYKEGRPWVIVDADAVLNRVALMPAAIGVAMLVAGRRSRYFVNVVRRYTWPAYAVLLAGMGLFTFVLGNKNEVFTALLTGVLAYAGSVRRPPRSGPRNSRAGSEAS